MPPTVPPTFVNSSQVNLLKLQQECIAAFKAQNFRLALDKATLALNLDPGNAVIQQLLPLLQEKIDLGESSDEEDSEGAEPNTSTNPDFGDAGESSGEDEDDTDDDEDDEEEEDENEDDDKSSTVTEPGPAELRAQMERAAEAAAAALQAITLDATNSSMSHKARADMKKALAAQVKKIQQKEVAKKLVESDPLLGA